MSTLETVVNPVSNAYAIRKVIYFGYNYDHKFIEKVWGEGSSLANHLRSKFNGYYEQVGAGAVFAKFFVNLDTDNQNLLANWISENYTGV